jgi:hypothetical protein
MHGQVTGVDKKLRHAHSSGKREKKHTHIGAYINQNSFIYNISLFSFTQDMPLFS